MATPTSGAGPAGKRATTVQVELTRDELSTLLVHVQTQYAELERALGGLEEEEGESVTKWNLKRSLKPQVEMLQDLMVKLEMAAREAGWR